MSSVGYATLQVIPSIKGLSSAITAQLNAQMGSAGNQAGEKLGAATGTSFLSSFAKHVGSIAVGVLVAQGVKQIADFMGAAFIGFNSQMQTANIGFTTMLGSAQKAGDFLDQLTNFAAKTPFATTDLVNYSKQLLAMGVSAGNVIPYMTAIGDAAAGLGTGSVGVEALTRAIGQMTAKGKIQSDELLQLTEAGVPALAILAAAYGTTTGHMQEMITAGDVLSKDAVPALIKGLEDGTAATAGFGGMMEAQSKTFSGAWSNIKDTVTKAIGETTLPLFNKLSDALVGISGYVQGPGFAAFVAMIGAKASDGLAVAADGMGRFVGWVKSVDWSPLGDALGKVKDAVLQLGPPLLALFENQAAGKGGIFVTLLTSAPTAASAVKLLSDVLVPLIQFLADHTTTVQVFGAAILGASAAMKAMAIVTAVTASLTTLMAVISNVAVWAELALAIRSTGDAMAFLDLMMDANPIGAVVIGIAALIAVIVYLEVKFHFLEKAWDGIKVAWEATANWFSGPFVNFFVAIGNWFAGPFLTPFKAIGDFFSGPFLVPFQAVGNFFTQTLPAAIGAVVSFFVALPGQIGDALAALPGMALKILEDMAYWFGYGVGLVVKEMILLPGQIAGIASDIGSFLSGWAQRIWTDLQAAWNATVSAVVKEFFALPGQLASIGDSVWSWLSGWAARIWHDLQAAWNSAVHAVVTEFYALPGQISSIASTVWNNITSWVSNVYHSAVDGFRNLVSGAVSEFRALPGQVYSIASEIPGQVGKAVSGAASWLYNAGRDAVTGLIHGVESMFSSVGSIFKDLANKAMQGFKDALGIKSPSRVFKQYGQFTVAGFVNGVNGAAPKAISAVSNMLGAANAAVPSGQTAAAASNRTLNYYAAPGNSLSAEDDLFAAGRRAALVF